MKSKAPFCLLLIALGGAALAQEGSIPRGIRHLDHVFVILMENHGYSQLVGNPAAPFINQYMKQANLATNYLPWAIPARPTISKSLEDRTSATAATITRTGITRPARRIFKVPLLLSPISLPARTCAPLQEPEPTLRPPQSI